MTVEQVALGGHFATQSQLGVVDQVGERLTAQRQSPSTLAVIHNQYGRFVHSDHIAGNGKFLRLLYGRNGT